MNTISKQTLDDLYNEDQVGLVRGLTLDQFTQKARPNSYMVLNGHTYVKLTTESGHEETFEVSDQLFIVLTATHIESDTTYQEGHIFQLTNDGASPRAFLAIDCGDDPIDLEFTDVTAYTQVRVPFSRCQPCHTWSEAVSLSRHLTGLILYC